MDTNRFSHAAIGGLLVALLAQANVGARRIPTLTPEQAEILGHLSIVYLDDGQGGTNKTVRIEGVNVQIVNGLGATASINGTGNLIVGYNALGHPSGDDRTGSHNLVAGDRNSFLSSGGVVFGLDNTISDRYCAVSGGHYNTASDVLSAVTGGTNNVADGFACSVNGGTQNTASDNYSSVSGGLSNTANGFACAVSGGSQNAAYEVASSVSGGNQNTANGIKSSVSGGAGRTVSGPDDWAAGSLFEDN